MEVTNKEILPLIDLLFEEKYWFYKHQYESFHQFIDEIIYRELKEGSHVFHEDFTKDKVYRHKFIFDNISLKPAINDIDDELMWPEDARKKNLTYSSKLVATVQQAIEIVDIASDARETKNIGEAQKEVPLAKIPIMVKSKFCTTVIKKDEPNRECRFDPGGYFIVNGSEKVIMSLERICENKLFVFTKKDPTFKNNIQYYSQVNSKSDNVNNNIQMTVVKMRKDDSMIISMAQLIDIPIFVMFRALGVVTDYDIIKYCVYDMNDIEMINIIKNSLEYAIFDPTKPPSDINRPIKTQDDAITYLVSKLKQTKKYIDTDKDIRNAQRRMHLIRILKKDFLPHMGENLVNKAHYMGLMVHKLLSAFLGRTDSEDRDSYVNKRVDTPGILMAQLFKQYFKKMMSEISKFFKKKNSDYYKPINVVNQIKPNTIEQGLKSGLLTGLWGASKKGKKGVAQVLQRLTYMQTLSYLRRIITPSIDPSTSKVVNIRHVHNVQFGFLDPVESPDGHNVGVVKHLSLSSGITLALTSQVYVIKNLLINKLTSLQDVDSFEFKRQIRVFVNGEWIGITKNPIDITTMLKKKRMEGVIDKTVSIVFDIGGREIRIYCDGGRLYRPLLRVENNKLVLNKKVLSDISLTNKTDKMKINKWSDLLVKHPEIMEYIDVEESEGLMISMFTKDIENERRKMMKKIPNPQDPSTKINRYDDTVYKKYTHCELHPQMLLGITSSQVPFAEHNPSPRNVFNFSQSRQAMGIYASNYRYRMDISYVLYHPQMPLVTTRAAKWLATDQLPAGENAIVAIACYSGYNQEDSIIANQSSFDRGLYRSTSLKKYEEEIKKNQSTSQDDKFMKPDRNQVSGMKHGNYDKLNEQGYVPEETEVVDGDIIIGKVSPIQPGAGTKLFKDSSHIFRGNVPSVIDKVYTNLYNSEGYEIYKMRIRSERTPIIGDKMCCFSPDHEILTLVGWIPIYKLSKEDQVATLVNDNELRYVKPTELQEYDYNGKMYEIKSNQVDLMVTPNHRMYVSMDGNKYKISEAKDIFNEIVYYKKNCEQYDNYSRNRMQNIFEDNIMIHKNDTLEDADRLQLFALHAGWSLNIIGDMYMLNRDDNQPVVNFSKKEDKWVDYNGKVYCCTVPSGIIYVRRNGIPVWSGNSRHGQKGTIGITLRRSDMPFTASGIQPDLIVNPNAIPSRMTIGQLLECVLAKVSSIKGYYSDATPFDHKDIAEAEDELEKLGFNKMGFETLYCGMTGKKIKAMIFIGPTYYLRLKHLVQDKIHSRSRGPRQLLTRQPPEGRSRDGGLRFGEMERDSCIGHGVSLFLKERFVETSDQYTVHICNKCGLFASKMINKNVWGCWSCKNYTDVSKVSIPYAFKLLIQELQSINILPRIKTRRTMFMDGISG